MFTDTLVSYYKNKMTINYNSLINTVKELDDNDIINRYDILLSLVLIYIGSMWLTYFVGLFKGERLQTKYQIENIN